MFNSASSAFGTTRSSLYQNGGNDWGKIVLYSGAGASGTGYYANYAGGKNRIRAVRPVITDEYVCKYGTATQATCGTVVSVYGTVTYGKTKVNNIARAAICNKPGDSGAPIAAPDTSSTGIAKGILSGTNGTCGIGKLTYFSRLDQVLAYYNASLNTLMR